MFKIDTEQQTEDPDNTPDFFPVRVSSVNDILVTGGSHSSGSPPEVTGRVRRCLVGVLEPLTGMGGSESNGNPTGW